MCIKTIEVAFSLLELIPNQYRMQEIYYRVVKADVKQHCC